MKRFASGEVTTRRGQYMSKGVSPETKVALAQYAAGAKREGVSIPAFVGFGAEADYQPKTRTLQAHVAAINAGESPLLEEKKSGSQKKLSEEELHILFGAVLADEKPVGCKQVQDHSWKLFGDPLSQPTASRYMQLGELSYQLHGTRSMPSGMSFEDYVLRYHEQLLELQRKSFFTHGARLTFCIDSATNSHRIRRQRGFNGIGATQKKFKGLKFIHTDTYVIVVWMDGVNRTPCLCFTHNKAFADDSPEAAAILAYCRQMGVARVRIIYLPSKKQYCGEKPEQYAHFCQVYKREMHGAYGLRDGGPAFKKRSDPIVEQYAQEVHILESATHGESSIVDCNVNSIAKNNWDSMRDNCEFEWQDTINLLHAYDNVDSESIKRMWVRNFLLDKKAPTLRDVENMLRGNKNVVSGRAMRHEAYKQSYYDHLQQKEREGHIDFKRTEGYELDGGYWANNKKNF